MNFDEFENFLLSSQCFDNHDVAWICEDQKVHYHQQDDFYDYYAFFSKLLAEEKHTIKIEQMERHYNKPDVTIHLFYNPVNGPSFPEHTDPMDVGIECTSGIKTLDIEGMPIALEAGDYIDIPAGTPHHAINSTKSVMLSYGFNDTETLNRIREDNRDLQPEL